MFRDPRQIWSGFPLSARPATALIRPGEAPVRSMKTLRLLRGHTPFASCISPGSRQRQEGPGSGPSRPVQEGSHRLALLRPWTHSHQGRAITPGITQACSLDYPGAAAVIRQTHSTWHDLGSYFWIRRPPQTSPGRIACRPRLEFDPLSRAQRPRTPASGYPRTPLDWTLDYSSTGIDSQQVQTDWDPDQIPLHTKTAWRALPASAALASGPRRETGSG